MGIFRKYYNMTRKPEGILGKIMARRMNVGHHVRLANWGMRFLPKRKAAKGCCRSCCGCAKKAPFRICDFGCGGGRNVGELLRRFKRAEVTGLDYSDVSVKETKKRNARAIKAGRCQVVKGDVSRLDLPAGSLDLATAFETVYFWPGLAKCFAEVRKTLRPGGAFLIVNEDDGEDEAHNRELEAVIDGLKLHKASEIKAALLEAGFSAVRVWHHKKHPWIAVLAKN